MWMRAYSRFYGDSNTMYNLNEGSSLSRSRNGARAASVSRSAGWHWTILPAFLLTVVLTGPALAQESADHKSDDVDDVVTGETHESSHADAEAHYHKNHIAVFIGMTEAEEHNGEQEDPDFTLGVDYERRLSTLFGLGGLLDFVIEGKREYVVAVPVFLHVGSSAKFQLAPGFHHLSHTNENEWLLRTGVMWTFHVKTVSILPAFYYDITEGQNFFVLGVNFGIGL
jgi:hypothetical protein